MSKDDKEVKIPIVDKELDLSNAGRGVWLVKVPKYIAQKWEKAPSNMDVGKLRISKTPGQKAQVSLSLSQAVVKLDPQEEIPTEHILDVSVVTKQTLGVFSHMVPQEAGSGSSSKDTSASTQSSEKLYMEGRIVQKLECRPIADNCYMKLKLESIRKASVPVRKVQPIDKIVQNFKPVKDHAHNVSLCRFRNFEMLFSNNLSHSRSNIGNAKRPKVRRPVTIRMLLWICSSLPSKNISTTILRIWLKLQNNLLVI